MSSVNLPKDPISVDSSQVPPQTNDLSQVESSSAVNKDTKDTIEIASGDEVSTQLASPGIGAPKLAAPQSSNSIVAAFRAWSEATRTFRNELSASDLANLEARSRYSALAAAQAADLAQIIADKEAANNKLLEELQVKIDELNQKLEEMEQLAKDQQNAIDNINAGNGKEQQEYSKLVRAYDDYVSKMKELGAVDLGNGKFAPPTEPPEAVEKFDYEKFNQYTATYQGAVSDFNQYWKGRSAEIDKYNKTAADYNQKIAEYNKGINDFIKENNLTDFVNQKGMSVPQLSQAAKRSLDGYQSEMGAPPKNCEPPAYARSIAQGGPSAIPKLPIFDTSSFDTDALKQEMYNNAYDSRIAPFDQAIAQCNLYTAFIASNLESIDKELANDSLLNSKALAQKLLAVKPSVSQTHSSGSLALQTMGLDDTNMQAIMGMLLIKEVITQANIKAFDKLTQEKKEAKIEQLTNKLALLSVGFLSNQSVLALLPTLGFLSEPLASLPKNSPAFAILFAVSLSNRIGEDVKHGVSTEALENFLNSVPEFAALPAEDKAKLVASLATSLNIGHLLVASKLLEDSLGLQGLLAQILPGLSPALNPNQMISQAKQGDQQGQLELQANIKENFIEKGYPEDKAQFFAQVGTELVQNGLLTPDVTANISEKNINLSLLEKSITAELALSPQYSLESSRAIAKEAISSTLDDAPFSAKQFRSTLESHLTDLGVKNSSEVATAAVIIPPPEKLLASVVSPPPAQTVAEPTSKVPPSPTQRVSEPTRPNLNPTASEPIRPTPTQTVAGPNQPTPTSTVSEPSRTVSPSPTSTTPEPTRSTSEVPRTGSDVSPSSTAPIRLTPTELAAIVEKRALQLLVPQLGPQLAKQVSQEIAKTLFGNPNPDSRDVANLKSPFSLVNVMNDQLYQLNIENHENWASAIHETFTDSLKTMTSFPAFARKVQDPAYKYVLASSIIYGDQGRKNAIDIPI